jgi:elongation factor G
MYAKTVAVRPFLTLYYFFKEETILKYYNAKDIRNIAIAGHAGRGKTTLAEAMLYVAGLTDRLGRVDEGNTVLDSDPEEKRRHVSVSAAMAPIEWKDCKLNIIDTPGLFDFEGEMQEGIRASECVLIVMGSGHKYDVGAEKAFNAAKKRGKMFAITRCDKEHADFYKTFEEIRAVHGGAVCPVIVPYIVDGNVKAYVNLASRKGFEYVDGKAKEIDMPDDPKIHEMLDILTEAVATADDDMMEKFFAGEEFTRKEIVTALNKGVSESSVYPVYACSGYTMDGVDLLLDELAYSAPDAASYAGGKDIECDENGPLAAICFKTVADPFVGKMSFFKVASGKITPETPVYNARTGETERMGKIITVRGNKSEDCKLIPAGDIGVVTKLTTVKTGDTICSASNVIELGGIQFPKPCLSMSVKACKKGDEEKIVSSINRLLEEDPTIKFELNNETKEQILSGLGEQHLDIIVSKLKSKFGVDIELTIPRVAYREAIRKTVKVQGRHKKQSGGHGQFGDVWIRFEPAEGDDLIFESEVVGGSVPKNYFPAVEKGLRECIKKGVLAGYPMVGLKAVLYDGSYHPVDSSEMAFKTAASLAYKAGIPQASPTILEPIGTLKAVMPEAFLGDIMGDVTKRRGRVLGMGASEEDPKLQELDAEVPMAEMYNFSTILRSITAGRGHFTFEFTRYEDAPANIIDKVIADSQAFDEE